MGANSGDGATLDKRSGKDLWGDNTETKSRRVKGAGYMKSHVKNVPDTGHSRCHGPQRERVWNILEPTRDQRWLE